VKAVIQIAKNVWIREQHALNVILILSLNFYSTILAKINAHKIGLLKLIYQKIPIIVKIFVILVIIKKIQIKLALNAILTVKHVQGLVILIVFLAKMACIICKKQNNVKLRAIL